MSDGASTLVDPHHRPTMGELMSQSAGFGVSAGDHPIDLIYRGPDNLPIFKGTDAHEFVRRVAKAPLFYQPGTRWRYSVGAHIQGYLIEKMSGESFPAFLRRRLFEPLGMSDTAFYVPEAKRDRFASMYAHDAEGRLVPSDFSAVGLTYDREPAFPTGGAGLVSTATDYYRFAQMLLNGGQLDGVRILSPQSVKLMLSNHLTEAALGRSTGLRANMDATAPGVGAAYGGNVILDPAAAQVPSGAGTYFWGGAAGTWVWIDPANDLVVVGLVQTVREAAAPNSPRQPSDIRELVRGAVYRALVHPER